MTISGIILVYVINFFQLWTSIATIDKNPPIYSLVTDLEPLLQTQRFVMDNLQIIIAEQKTTFKFIRSEMKRFKTEHEKVVNDTTGYLRNYIHVYRLIKRLNKDFDYTKQQIEKHTHTRLYRSRSLKYPSYSDFDEAGRMVLRLQRVYLINITKLADGLLESAYSGNGDGETYREMFLPMTASDCFELSKVIYENKFYKSGIKWLIEAQRLFPRGKPNLDLKKYEIIEAISNGYKALNNTAKQLEWAKKLVGLKPDLDYEIIRDLEVRTDIKKLGLNFKTTNPQEFNQILIKKPETKDVRKQQEEYSSKLEASVRKAFRKLCRGNQTVPRDVRKRVKCWYFSGHHPFTRLARFRAEQLFVQPEVILLHNAVSDAEIQTIINIARPKLIVRQVDKAKSTRSSMYINLSKGWSFQGEQSRPIESVTQRLSDMTGYWTTLLPLVATNYGVGGHYTPHMDSASWVDKNGLVTQLKQKYLATDILKDINKDIDSYMADQLFKFRIATVLLYLSDVEQGGFTAFPLLGLAVPPEKGAALIWTNLLPSGMVDHMLIHGACAVLRGSKWVATKWIKGIGQELRKPCTKRNTSRRPDGPQFQQKVNVCFKENICLTRSV